MIIVNILAGMLGFGLLLVGGYLALIVYGMIRHE